MQTKIISIIGIAEAKKALTKSKEDITMALSNLFGWGKKEEEQKASAACGAADKPAETPAACGAAEKPTEKPAACGSACGAGDKK